MTQKAVYVNGRFIGWAEETNGDIHVRGSGIFSEIARVVIHEQEKAAELKKLEKDAESTRNFWTSRYVEHAMNGRPDLADNAALCLMYANREAAKRREIAERY